MTATLLFLGNLGGSELVLIFLVVLLLFGGKKIPELMQGLGRGIRDLAVIKAMRDGLTTEPKMPTEQEEANSILESLGDSWK